jgi:hypothetical protein
VIRSRYSFGVTRPDTLLRWITGAQIALLAWTWAAPLATRGHCPHGATAAVAGGHAGHERPDHDEQSRSRQPAPCDCVGHCNAARAPLLPSAVTLPEPPAVVALADEPTAPAAVPLAAPHLEHLPFSTAPPVA